VYSPLVRDTLGRFDVGWRAVLAEARAAWLGSRVPDAVVTHVSVGYRRPLGREAVSVTCSLDAVGRASFRTRETVAPRASRPRRRSSSPAAR
jgi:hypothetical protein